MPRVTILERNEKLGKKIYITGKGRCNATNACDKEAFFKNIVRNPRFLYASFARLSNLQLLDLLESLGCPMKVERGDRAFPVSDKASDVTGALSRELRRLGVEVEIRQSNHEGTLVGWIQEARAWRAFLAKMAAWRAL